MVIPKINSSHGSDTRNIINTAIDSINTQGKSIQDLVAKGQLTPTQYAQLISIVNGNVSKGSITAADIDKNNFKLDQTYMSDSLLQMMAGNTPINAVPANGSITTEKMAQTSVNKTILSNEVNLFSIFGGVLLGEPLIVDFTAGEITVPKFFRFMNGSVNTSVNGGYVLNFTDATSNNIYLVFNYSNKNLELINYDFNIDNRKYAVVGAISKTYNTLHIVGDYKVAGEESRVSISPFNAALSTMGKNLKIDFTNQTLSVNTNGRPYFTFNEKVLLFTGGEYSFSSGTNTLFLGYDRDDKRFIFIDHTSLNEVDMNYTPIFGIINKVTEEVFINGIGYEVVRTGGNNGSEGEDSNAGGIGLSRPYHFLGDPGGSYIPKIEDYYYKASYHNHYENFMAEWEVLRSNYPEYVTRKQIGTSVQGRAIYRYDFNYYDVMNPIDGRPIIYVNNGIHAIETHGIYAILAFFKDLCDNWLNDDQLGFIHNNIHLVVVPLANPDGFVANTRQNANGVDINRNFTRGWNNKNNEVKGDLTFPGTGPLSEPETRALESLLEEIKPLYTFDIHNNGSLESKKDLISMSTGPDRLRYFAKAFGNSFDYRMRKRFPEIKDWNAGGRYNLVMDRLANPGGSLAYSAVQLGSNGSTVEFTTGWDPYPPETHQYINKDAMGNLILGVMRSTDRL